MGRSTRRSQLLRQISLEPGLLFLFETSPSSLYSERNSLPEHTSIVSFGRDIVRDWRQSFLALRHTSFAVGNRLTLHNCEDCYQRTER